MITEENPRAASKRTTSPLWDRWPAQRLVPVVDAAGKLKGVLTAAAIRKALQGRSSPLPPGALGESVKKSVNAGADEPLRVIVNRMAERGVTRMPVIEPKEGRLVGLVTLDDLLKARARQVEEERRREQPLRLPYLNSPPTESPKADS